MQPTTPTVPTVFGVLAKQYRDWSASFVSGNDPEDALPFAKIAVVDIAIGTFEVGDYVLVWDRGLLPGGQKRLCAWAGPASKVAECLLHDVQDSVRVIWERVS
jgi:hypothetical protein